MTPEDDNNEAPAWRRYLRFWGNNTESDVGDELDFHFSMRVDDLRRSGLSEIDARARAQREFGDVKGIRTQMTEIGERRARRHERWRMLEALWLDATYGLRSLMRNPGFALVAVLTLALGIGANTAIFTTVEAILLRPLPFRAPDQLYVVWNHYQSAGRVTLAPAEFADVMANARGFASWSALSYRELNLTGDGDPEHVAGLDVSPNFFETLGVSPAIGRSFSSPSSSGVSADDQVALVSHDLWARRYGANGQVIGRRMTLDGASYTIVGVMPKSFEIPNPAGFMLPRKPEVFIPRDLHATSGVTRGDKYLRIIGRASRGTSSVAASASIADVSQAFRTQLPGEYPEGWHLEAVSLQEQTVGSVRGALVLILVVVALVLLIACINVANLVLARTTGRRQEMAVRTSLGATRGRVVRQLFAENMILALFGGTLGILLAYFAVQVLASMPLTGVPRLAEVRVDGRVLRVAFLVTVVTGLLLGLAATMSTAGRAIQQSLRAGGRGVVSGGGRARAALVVAEIALACVVLVGTGVALNSLLQISRIRTGFEATNRTVVDLNLPAARYASGPAQAQVYDRVVESVRALPGVVSAAVVHPLPLSGDLWNADFTVEGGVVRDAEHALSGALASVTPDYFATMGIPVRDGRAFNNGDRPNAQSVVIMDRVTAESLWPGVSAIGKRMHVGGSPDSVWSTVVGVVDQVTSAALALEQKPQIYLPHSQRPRSSATLVIHTSSANGLRIEDIRRAFARVDADLPVSAFRRMDAVVAASMAPQRYVADLVGVFGIAALLLAAVGLYGLVAYGVTQRTRELGVRMALGARTIDVVVMIVREGAMLSLIGVGIGIAAAIALETGISTAVFDAAAAGPELLAIVVGVLTLVAVLACYIPARRAATMDPLSALSAEH